jgi:hypothetical protein
MTTACPLPDSPTKLTPSIHFIFVFMMLENAYLRSRIIDRRDRLPRVPMGDCAARKRPIQPNRARAALTGIAKNDYHPRLC